MARTIRLNTSTGAAAGGGAAGLSTADVERVVEDKARWILDYEKDYGNDIPNGWLDTANRLSTLIIAFPTRP